MSDRILGAACVMVALAMAWFAPLPSPMNLWGLAPSHACWQV